VLSRVFIGRRPLIGPVHAWCYKYRNRQLCRGDSTIVQYLRSIFQALAVKTEEKFKTMYKAIKQRLTKAGLELDIYMM